MKQNESSTYFLSSLTKDEFLEKIMHEFGNDVLRLAFSYVKDKELAEDIAQTVFIKCYKHKEQFNGGNLQSWIFRITVNCCRDYFRSWHYKHTYITEKILMPLMVHSPEQILLDKSEDELIAQSILALPKKYREIIYLFYFEDLSLNDISTILEININTIKTRHKRAKELFKKLFLERKD